MTSKRAALRTLVESNELTRIPIVHDALTAKLAAAAGFEAISLSGHGVSISALGLPDAGYLTMPEAVTVSRNVAQAVDTPVYTDVDTGFGNAINARRTAEEVVRNTECAGFHIEDQADPKRCGQVAGKRVISRSEMREKVRAVCDLRDEIDPEFVVIGRTDALGVTGGGPTEAIDRGNDFVDAGADLVFVDGIHSKSTAEEIGRGIDGPLLYNKSGPNRSLAPAIDEATLSEWGYSFVSYHASMTPTIRAVHRYMSQLKDRGMDHVVEFEAEMDELPVGDFYAFEGMDEVVDLEREYLPEEEMEKYQSSIGKDI